MVKSNRHEAHCRIFCIPLFLPPPDIKYSPHHPAPTNPQSVFFSWHKTTNFTPTQNDRNNVSFTDQYMQRNILNWMTASIARTYPALFSKIVVLLTFCQDLTYLKQALQQTDSGTSHPMWLAWDFTTTTAQNPFSAVQLFHQYWLPEKPEILNVC